MSTLKTNNIQHVDLADPSILLNSDGSVSIAGTVSYEDSTNVDSVGIITGRLLVNAQKQVHVGTGVSVKAGGLNVTAGITTVQALQATTGNFSSNVDIAGELTVAETIAHTGDTNNKISFPAADTITLTTSGSEALRVDASQRLLIGTSDIDSVSDGEVPKLIVKGTDSTAGAAFVRHSANAAGTGVFFGKSRNATIGSNTIVQDDDELGRITFSGDDGTNINTMGVQISSFVDGTPGENDMPGRLVFYTTADGASGVTERMRITSGGDVGINRTPTQNDMPGVTPRLHVLGISTVGQFNTVARFESGTTDGNDTGAAVVINQTNDRGLVIQGGRGGDADGVHHANSGLGRFSIINNSGTFHKFMEAWGQNGQYIENISLFTGNEVERLRINSSGVTMLGSGAQATPKITGPGGLDVSQYALSICMGGSSGSSGQARADATTKEARLVIPHYTNAEQPMVVAYGYSQNDKNVLNLGGGTGLGNNATEINLHCASDITTTGANNVLKIDPTYITTVASGIIRTQSSAGSLTLYGGNTNHGGKIAMYGGNSDATIRFYSQTGTGSPAERLRIASNQILYGSSSVLGGGGLDAVRINNSSSYRGLVLRGTGGSGGIANYDEYCFLFNRMGSDGAIVTFNAQGTQEGSISVSGSTVSYNGGHLSRWSQLVGISTNVKSDRPTIYQGTVMSNLDEMCEWTGEDNQQLNKTKVSDTVGDKNVAGVFWTWDDDDDVYTNDFYVAMVGDMVIRVDASTAVARGDLLESAGDGTAKPQSDDIVRSKTIAKITSTTSTATYPDGTKAYPCVLMGS